MTTAGTAGAPGPVPVRGRVSPAPAGPAGLAGELHLDRGELRLRLPLDAAPGETVALLGPNGAGKTTALRALAGLQPLTAGTLTLAGEVLDDPAAGRFVPAQRRPVGVVFQDYLLFPHLSALDNVAFGLRARGRGRAEARRVATGWLERVGVGELAGVRPGALSGGQAQRVALARALAADPRLLLLDEPLAALDAGTRPSVRSTLRRHLADYGGVTVLVTHDPLDAMLLGTRLVVLEAGRVVQAGPPAEVARRPRTAYVASLVGLNLYRGTASGDRVQLAGGVTLTVAGPAPAADVFVAFAPSAVAVHPDRPHGSPRNAWPARVAGVDGSGATARVHLDGVLPCAADLTAAAVADLALRPGDAVWAAVKALETQVYPA